ncbi:MAG: hypothetical protein DI586_03520 [Micavibrio aeruginosavorus]|uniref:Uncharacterized protein n=1 Tax=Micavibrio aeruginosavorus TaxID=349221 RepID=A0A2W5FN67_9BACT|nr:MAG: hypothetical protein DI586_03520 [Micavibrio aeruginosavorus]
MRIKKLTIKNCPPCFAAFNAASWSEAVEIMDYEMTVKGKQSAIWIRDEKHNLQETETLAASMIAEFNWKVADDINYKFLARDLYNDVPNSVGKYMTEDEREAIRVLTSKGGLANIIKRFQSYTPNETSIAHYDLWKKEALSEADPAWFGSGFFGSRQIRLLDTKKGKGPILFEPQSQPLEFDDDGYVMNTEVLEKAWQLGQGSVVPIAGLSDWFSQAVLHSSPEFHARTPDKVRYLTVYDVNL